MQFYDCEYRLACPFFVVVHMSFFVFGWFGGVCATYLVYISPV
jgi:hypothetical protein